MLITNRLMWSVFEALYHLNQPTLISILLSEDFLLRVADVCDHGAKTTEPTGHRQFLESAQFMQILPIEVLMTYYHILVVCIIATVPPLIDAAECSTKSKLMLLLL
jgi:Component of IIS longevity pathway SMK-1